MPDFGITLDASGWLDNYGPFAWGPNIIVIHSLECDAVPHIAEELSGRGGYLDNEGLAPQRMTDPVSIVKTMPDGNQGGHIGGPGNSHCAGVEVSGRAAWTRSQWLDGGVAQAALEHQAKAVAGLAVVYGWSLSDLRWLSVAQIQAGSPRGLCSHNDISISGISNTNHWDPGTGFPFDWFLERVRYWFNWLKGTIDPPEDPDMSAAELNTLTKQITALRDLLTPVTGYNTTNTYPARQMLQYIDTNINNLAKSVASASDRANQAMNAARSADAKATAITTKLDALAAAVKAIAARVEADIALDTADAAVGKDTNADVAEFRKAFDNTPVDPPATEEYPVKAGDSFDAIAAAHGTDRAGLLKLNPKVTDPNLITVGQVLIVPKV